MAFNFSESGELITDQPESARPRGFDFNEDGTLVGQPDESTALGNAGRLLKMGVNTAAQDVRELVGKIPVVGEPIQSGLDWVDEKMHGMSSDELLKTDNAAMQAKLGPAMKEAIDKKWWDSTTNSFGNAWFDPRAYEAGLLQSLPEEALMIFPAMRLAKGAYAAKIAAGATEQAAALAAARTAQIAGTVIEGSLGGAQSSRLVRDEINDKTKITDETLATSDAYKSLLEQGMDPDQARKELANSQASHAFITSGVATGVFGGMGDRLLAKIIIGKSLGAGARFAAGAASEGLVEEFPQSYLQQVAQNEAIQKADPTRPLTEDALNQALQGAATGALQGGGMAAAFGEKGTPKPAVTDPTKSPILAAPTVDAAVDTFNATTNPGIINSALAQPAGFSPPPAEQAAPPIQPQPEVPSGSTNLPLATGPIPAGRTEQPGDLVQGGDAVSLLRTNDRRVRAGLDAAARETMAGAGQNQPVTNTRGETLNRRDLATREASTAAMRKIIEDADNMAPLPIFKGAQNALQKPSPASQISRTGATGENLTEGGQGIRPSQQGQETPQKGQAEGVNQQPGTIKTLSDGRYAAVGFTPEQIKAADPKAFIDGKGNGIFSAKTNKIQIERALGISTIPEGTILASGDKPFTKRGIALARLKTDKALKKTHRIVPIEGGYAIAPKVVERTGEVVRVGESAHQDIGEPAQAATPAVIEKSLNKGDANTKLTLAQMKEKLLADVDAALVSNKPTPEHEEYNSLSAVVNSPSRILRNSISDQQGKLKLNELRDLIGYTTFDVPGDGKFKVLNTKKNLESFRDEVAKAQGFKKTPTRQPEPLPALERPVSKSSPETYIKSVLNDIHSTAEDFQNALEAAKMNNIDSTELVKRHGERAVIEAEAEKLGVDINGMTHKEIDKAIADAEAQNKHEAEQAQQNPQADAITKMADAVTKLAGVVDKLANPEAKPPKPTPSPVLENQQKVKEPAGKPYLNIDKAQRIVHKNFDTQSLDQNIKDRVYLRDLWRAFKDKETRENADGFIETNEPMQNLIAGGFFAKAQAEANPLKKGEMGYMPVEAWLQSNINTALDAVDAAIKKQAAQPEQPSYKTGAPVTATVYHGSDHGSVNKQPSGLAFFTDEKSAAKRYGKKVAPVQIDLKNPKVIDYKGADDSDLIGFDIQDAEESGHDGIVALNTDDGKQILNQFVVFKYTEQPSNLDIQQEQAPIADFGQKIEGARKDLAAAMKKEYSDDDLASLPLSKIWPADLHEKIEDPFIAAIAFAARQELPSKPRVSYKVDRWVEKVKMLRSLATMMLASETTRARAEALLNESAGLKGFAAKVHLLEALDREQWSRIGEVGEFPNAYRYDENGKQVPAATVKVQIDGRTEYYPGAKSVADVIEKVNEKLGVAKAAAKMQFEIRGKNGKYFINKVGDSEYRHLKEFNTSGDAKEALDYKRDHYDDLVAAWESVKERDNVKETDVRGAENRPRTAQDWRKGKDITTEQFSEAFGFRGGQFGNWVSQGKNIKERQGMLNGAYDALMDLSDILGIPPKAISLNGELGMSFGARGSGSASAHYESDNLVINLTKTRGAGTLAHEWFHALDNYFQRSRKAPMDHTRETRFITYKPEPRYVNKKYPSTAMTRAELNRQRKNDPAAAYLKEENWQLDPNHPQGVRPEVEAKFADLVNALNESPMKKRASLIDKGASEGYWSRIIERAARSFENYVIAKMAEKGYNNDYLANVVDIANFKRDEGRYPYLKQEELAPVVEAFDNLFGEMQTKETDKGIALQSINRGLLNAERDEDLDPSTEESTKVQAGIEGKTPQQAAQFIIATGSEFQKEVAQKVLNQLNRLRMAGVKLELKIAHNEEKVPGQLLLARGLTDWSFAPHNNRITVWINGTDVKGKVGTSYTTVLHELIHMATSGMIQLGQLPSASNYKTGKDVADLIAVTDHIRDHFNQRVADSKAGNVELTDFETRINRRANNALDSAHEVLAWGLSNPEAQAYMESIPYPAHESAWTAFVSAIRRILGLSERSETAFTEILRIADNLMNDNVNEILGLDTARGFDTAIQMPRGSGQVYNKNTSDIDHQVHLLQDKYDVSRETARQMYESGDRIDSEGNKYTSGALYSEGQKPVEGMSVARVQRRHAISGQGFETYSDGIKGYVPAASSTAEKPMPIEYRESGALYFGEMGNNHVQSTDGLRFSTTPGGKPTLIIQHNLSEENLLHADRMGGIPVPSLAITHAANPLQSFGDITLVGGVDMANPKGYAATKVFGADIYSPRYPEISHRLDKSALSKLNKMLAPYREGREIYGAEINSISDLTENDAFRKYAKDKIGETGSYAAHKQLAADMLNAAGSEERIFRGFTYSGNRKYTPHTLDNVVSILKKELRGGENFNYGVGNVRAAFTPQFKTIKQIQEAKGRLIGNAEFEKVKEEINAELFSLADKLAPYHPASGRTFGHIDTVTSTLYDAAKMGLPKAFKENGFDEVPQELQTEAAQFLNQLRNLPTEYFEAKILRAVDLSEFKGAVIPSDASQKVIDALHSRGVTNIVTYERHNQEDRTAKIQQLAKESDLLFSTSNDQDTQVHRLLDAHSNEKGYTREDAVQDYFNGKRIDSEGNKYTSGALYSEGQKPVEGMSKERVQRATAKLRMRWLGFRKINIVQSVKDMPTDFRHVMQSTARYSVNQNTEGFYDPKTNSVYLIADNIATPERAVWVATHETAHAGLRMIDKTVADSLDKLAKNSTVSKLAAAIAKDRGDITPAKTQFYTKLSQSESTEEAFAELSAAIQTDNLDALLNRYGVKVPQAFRSNLIGMVNRVVEAIRNFIAKVMGRTEVTDAEVRGIINEARRAVEGKGNSQFEPAGVAMASTAPKQTDTAAFRNWFGQSVVTEDGKAGGKPLVIYHSTNDEWTSFDARKTVSSFGFHAGTKDQAEAVRETGGTKSDVTKSRPTEGMNIMPVFLKISNPLRMEDKGAWYSHQMVEDLAKIGIEDKSALPSNSRELAGYGASHMDLTWERASNARKHWDLAVKERMRTWRAEHPNLGRDAYDEESRLAGRDYVRGLIEKAGYDGIVYDNKFEGKGDSYIAFKPTQIKSAIGNNGQFSPTNPNILFSTAPKQSIERAKAIGGSVIDRMKPTVDALIYNYQDKFVDLKNIQKQTAPKSEQSDAYLAAEQYPGQVRAKTDDFHDDQVDPLIKAIHEAGLKYDEVQEYLWAKHAPEYNAVMKERNPTAEELEAKKQELADLRDSLAGVQAVQDYLALRRKLQNANADVADGLADQTQVEGYEQDIADLRDAEPDVAEYLDSVGKLRDLQGIRPFVGDNTALSGMTDERAAEIIAQAKTDGKFDRQEKIAGMVHEITEGTRLSMLEGGLITQAESDAWESLWANYVPFHRDEVSEAMPRIGQGFNVRGKESKHATGSTKDVTNILAHVMAQREAAIIRTEKVKVERVLANFIKENPDSEIWELDTAKMVNDLDKKTGLVVRRVDPTFKNMPNVLTYKVAGKEHTITFNEKNVETMRLVASLKNMSAAELGDVTILMGKVTRFLATMNTSANPVFVATNFMRDLQTAFVNLSDTELHGMKKEVFRNIPKAIRGMWSMSRGNLETEWSKHAREFRDAGGQVGYTDYYKDISARALKLQDQLEGMGDGKWNWTKREAAAYWNVIEDANLAVENGVRLAAFVAARNTGMSIAKSASLAKNLTVNFNRHGAKGVEINMWYMFANASIQGTARLFQAAKNKNVQKIIGGVVASGFLLDILARAMAGDDDDDGENDYDQLPEYVKQKKFVFWVDGTPVTIPMPYGYNFFSNVGRKMSQSMFQKDYSPARGAVELFAVAFDAFSPTGQSGSALQLAAPTIADPFVQWAENKNFTGNPMYKEQSPFGLAKPEYQMGFKSVSAPSQSMAESLNTITGGNQVRPGWLNVNPALFDFAVTSALGGAGRTYLQLISLPVKTLKGDDIQAREVPFANIFLSAQPEAQVERKYYDSVKAVETVAQEIKLYAGDPEKMNDIRMRHVTDIRMIGMEKYTSSILKNIRKRELEIEKSNPPNKRELLKQLDERKNKMMSAFNKRYSQQQASK